ncbi:SusC/RagA family TonB-linked outer membrane protein [Parapedobacter tibetensis]|uniref:SusC/RagA family TonB-linked outer membrane protein n=1 Tax=Parapedobacter tibetensis TaxID=2972951 RepID=UPI00214D634B|nr:SusC/RagA family TonB-linked outer membrane protein [Parapedobacter tibetensis]
MNTVPLAKALEEIERKSGYSILIRSSDVALNEAVSISMKDRPIQEILDALFKHMEISYRISGKQIAIFKPLQEPSSSAVAPAVRQQQANGTVLDESSNPISGASIVLKGTGKGTLSDSEGRFALAGVSIGDTLYISYTGFLAKNIGYSGQGNLEIVLTRENKYLDEVVVVGYGTQRKADVTSSIASVKSEDFIQAPVKNAGQLLQGKVAGLTIASSSGDPTSGVAVLLRGNTTILGANANPLVLIDGIPGDLNTVAPEDIESIDVLKDGSAAAIYGVRGSNGVIIITTKRFKEGQINALEYSTQLSAQTIARQADMLTAEDYRRQITEGTRDASWDNGNTTDWFEEATQTPFSQLHNLTYRGGNAETNYLFNVNYRDFNGIMRKSDNETFNGRVDVEHNMFDRKLKFNLGIIGRQNSYTTTGDGSSFDGWIYRQITIQNPTSPIKNENGDWFQEGIFDYDNPLARLYETDGRNKSQYTRYNAKLTFTPIDALRLEANVAYDKYNQSRGYAETKKHISTTRDGRNGYASIGNDENIYRFIELIGEYKKDMGDHKLSILGGYGYQESERFNSSMQNWDFPTDVFGYARIGDGKALAEGNAAQASNREESNLISFFGRSTYSYKDKYLLMASVRHEAASQLYGADKPWGTFPAVSLGWRINEEPFMKNLGFVDDLKLRMGYGITGNPPNNLFLGVATLEYADYFLINGSWVRSLRAAQNPNPHLRWEEKKELNFGLDYSFLSGRIYGAIDYYNRRIDGLLYDYQVPSPPNIYTSTRANVGIMENTGLEVELSMIPVRKSDFTWTTQLLFSTNSNKLVSLSNDLYQLETNYFTAGGTGVPIQTHTHIVEIGEKIGDFHGYKVVDISDDGYWIYEDENGDMISYNEFNRGFEDKQVLGNGIPKYYAGWNNTFKYKNWDLGVTMRGSFDYQIINFQRMYNENTGDERYNRLASAYDKIYGKAVLNKNVPLEFNSHYVEDGDFWKIDNITLGYNFRKINLNFVHSARIYVSSLNTITITGYKGIDPEVNWTGLDPGIDGRDKYPTTRTFTVGINVSF